MYPEIIFLLTYDLIYSKMNIISNLINDTAQILKGQESKYLILLKTFLFGYKMYRDKVQHI